MTQGSLQYKKLAQGVLRPALLGAARLDFEEHALPSLRTEAARVAGEIRAARVSSCRPTRSGNGLQARVRVAGTILSVTVGKWQLEEYDPTTGYRSPKSSDQVRACVREKVVETLVRAKKMEEAVDAAAAARVLASLAGNGPFQDAMVEVYGVTPFHHMYAAKQVIQGLRRDLDFTPMVIAVDGVSAAVDSLTEEIVSAFSRIPKSALEKASGRGRLIKSTSALKDALAAAMDAGITEADLDRLVAEAKVAHVMS